MRIVNPKVCATQFALLAAISNGGDTIGQLMSGSLIVLVGFTGVFLFSGWLLGPPLLILYFININKNCAK